MAECVCQRQQKAQLLQRQRQSVVIMEKSSESVQCAITGQCLRMRHRPSAVPIWRSFWVTDFDYLPISYLASFHGLDRYYRVMKWLWHFGP